MEEVSILMSTFVEYVKRYIPNPKIIIDLGSMDAGDSVYFKTCFPEAEVYSIEGLEENYNSFKDMSQIIPIQAVVCNLDGEIDFHKKNINGIHGIYDRGNKWGSTVIKSKCCKFKTLIDKTIKRYRIDVLKIDVEGATYDVLISIEDYIYNIGIMHIETETGELFKNQTIEDKSFDYLKQHGFEMLDRKCCEIEKDKFQCDSVWINRRFL
jgi:FkbM family methyltransferase